MLRLVLIILLFLLLLGALPTWPYSGGVGILPERRPGSSSHHRAGLVLGRSSGCLTGCT